MSFRRILVALDASAHSLAALKAASERAGTVVLAGSSPLIRREDFPDLVAGIGCSVFIVR